MSWNYNGVKKMMKKNNIETPKAVKSVEEAEERIKKMDFKKMERRADQAHLKRGH